MFGCWLWVGLDFLFVCFGFTVWILGLSLGLGLYEWFWLVGFVDLLVWMGCFGFGFDLDVLFWVVLDWWFGLFYLICIVSVL